MIIKRMDREQEPEGFAEFWAVWRPHARHTDGRGQALKTYRKHVLKGASPADILDGAKCFIRTMKERDREFIPLASSWLNKEAYVDLAGDQREWEARREARLSRQAVSNVVPILPKNHFMNIYKQADRA